MAQATVVTTDNLLRTRKLIKLVSARYVIVISVSLER